MKQSLWIIALLFGSALIQPLSASSYSITLLDGNGPTVDGTGSFTFSGGVFSSFTVTWDSFPRMRGWKCDIRFLLSHRSQLSNRWHRSYLMARLCGGTLRRIIICPRLHGNSLTHCAG
jgi:hypothetical protein